MSAGPQMGLVLVGTGISVRGGIEDGVIITPVRLQDIQENPSNSGLEEIILNNKQ